MQLKRKGLSNRKATQALGISRNVAKRGRTAKTYYLENAQRRTVKRHRDKAKQLLGKVTLLEPPINKEKIEGKHINIISDHIIITPVFYKLQYLSAELIHLKVGEKARISGNMDTNWLTLQRC